MTGTCVAPIPWNVLVDYWADDLTTEVSDTVELHLMSCAECSEASASVAQVARALREMIPPVLTEAELAQLETRGLRIVENVFAPGERRAVLFPAEVDVLLHRLGGLDLSRAQSVAVSIHAESTGAPIAQLPSVPFDPGAGAVLIACQQHYAAYPHDTVFEVRTHVGDGTVTVERYTVLHQFESGGSGSV